MSSVILSSQYTSPFQIGAWYIVPNVTYTNAQIDFRDPDISAAIAKGILVFNDGTNLAAFSSNPVVQADVAVVDAQQGTTTSDDADVPATDAGSATIQQ